MASDAIFAQLQLGISFDKQKWKKQMELFDKPAGQQGARSPHAQSHCHDLTPLTPKHHAK
jgi:hypothetical protein